MDILRQERWFKAGDAPKRIIAQPQTRLMAVKSGKVVIRGLKFGIEVMLAKCPKVIGCCLSVVAIKWD